MAGTGINDEEKELLPLEEAIKMLPEGDEIHTYRNLPGVVFGTSFSRKFILNKLKDHSDTIEISGRVARLMGHGIAIQDELGPLFIETKKVRRNAYKFKR